MPNRQPGKTEGPEQLLPALHKVQAEYGYVSRHDAFEISKRLGVPVARVFEVLTFYPFFRLEHPGRVTISVCLGTSCHLQGAREVLAGFEAQLGVPVGTSTPDGHFHLQAVRCLGCCARSPVIKIGDRVFSQVDVSDIPAILHAYRKQPGVLDSKAAL